MVQLDDEVDMPYQVWLPRSSHQAPDARVCATSRSESSHLRTTFDNAGTHGVKEEAGSDTSELSALDDVLQLDCLAWNFDDTVTGRNQDILFSDLPSSPDSSKEIQWIPIPISMEDVESSSNFRSTSAPSPRVVAIDARVNSGESFRRPSELPVISYVPPITYIYVAQRELHNVSSSEEPSGSGSAGESLSPLSHRGIAALVEATECHDSRDAGMGWTCVTPSTELSIGIPDPYTGREMASEISRSSHDGKSDRLRTRLISTTVDEDGHREISQDLFINGPQTPSVASEHSLSEVTSAQICGNSSNIFKPLLPARLSSSPRDSSLAAPSRDGTTSAPPLGVLVATGHTFSLQPLPTDHGVSPPRRVDAVDVVPIGQSPLKAATNVDHSLSIGTDVGLSASDSDNSSASITRSSLMPPLEDLCLPLSPRPLSDGIPCGNIAHHDLTSASTSSRQSAVGDTLLDVVDSNSRTDATCATPFIAWTLPRPTDTPSVNNEAISNPIAGNSTTYEPLQPLLDDVVIRVHETCNLPLFGQKTSFLTKSLRISRTPQKGKRRAASNYRDADVQTESCTLTGPEMSCDDEAPVQRESLRRKIQRLEAEVKELKKRNQKVQERPWASRLSCGNLWRSMISEETCHERVQVSPFPDLHFATRFQ